MNLQNENIYTSRVVEVLVGIYERISRTIVLGYSSIKTPIINLALRQLFQLPSPILNCLLLSLAI